MLKSIFSLQFLKYGLVGLFATALDFSFLYVLVEFCHLHYFFAALISMAVLLVVSFSLNKIWTFKDSADNYLQQFGKYSISHLIALTISLSIMVTLVEGFHFWYIYAKFFATAAAAVTNFLLVKRFIFRPKKEGSS